LATMTFHSSAMRQPNKIPCLPYNLEFLEELAHEMKFSEIWSGAAFEKKPSSYMLISENEVVYVGRTDFINHRMMNHKSIGRKFDRVVYFRVHTTAQSHMLEGALTDIFLNKQVNESQKATCLAIREFFKNL
jgi:predicted GIY-YIG superfamily endonuclease